MILPSHLTEDELIDGCTEQGEGNDQISPWLYHVTLCQLAIINHRFNEEVRDRKSDLEALVKSTDEELASIVSGLPSHLAPHGDGSQEETQPARDPPWTKWQRIDMTTGLFLTRAKVNYQCRKYWSAPSPSCTGQRAVCLNSARSVIYLYSTANFPVYLRRHM
jgi:hypothetical protein